MRPDPLPDRPFFRREAESYRRLRHLGEIILFRPLSLRLVTLYPLLVVAGLALAMSQVELRLRFVGLLEEPPGASSLRLLLDPGAAAHVAPGDRVALRVAGAAERVHGSIAALTDVACSRVARALLPAHAQAAPQRCLQVTIATEGPVTTAEPPATVELWSPPQTYLAHLLRR